MSTELYRKAGAADRAIVQAETERYFATRAARSVPDRAKAILARAGACRSPERGDELPADLAARGR
ncbi:MAG: hypothetical protein K2X11_11370 [Acetobacteraceae bacterium]|nr:hypothetical protein [Acetobacteraceae bacterium]